MAAQRAARENQACAEVLYKGLTIVNTLLSWAGKKVSRRMLAEKTGLQPKQVGRYLNTLEDLYFPLQREIRGREEWVWVQAADGHRRPHLLPFTAEELTALYFYAVLSHPFGTTALHTALRSVRDKIASVWRPGPPPVGPLTQAFVSYTKHYKDYTTPQAQTKLALVVRALLESRPCYVTYKRPTASRARRYLIHPYTLGTYEGGLYVFAYVPDHDNVILLGVDRIRYIEVRDEAVFTPTPEVWQRIDARCDQAFGISDDGEVLAVQLRFTPTQAPYVRERLWHPTQQLTELPNGALLLQFQASGRFEIVRWVLGWGEHVEVLAPRTLRQEVAASLQAAAGQYAAPDVAAPVSASEGGAQ
jgi:predicted DNA-binding transcriptional regulator YafY